MSVSTGTVSEKQIVLPDRTILFCLGVVQAGDGTGGIVYYNWDLQPIVPKGSIVRIEHAQISHSDAVQAGGILVTPYFDMLPTGVNTIIACLNGDASSFVYNDSSADLFCSYPVTPLPFTIGRVNTVTNAYIKSVFKTNTNAKSYYTNIRIRIIPPEKTLVK